MGNRPCYRQYFFPIYEFGFWLQRLMQKAQAPSSYQGAGYFWPGRKSFFFQLFLEDQVGLTDFCFFLGFYGVLSYLTGDLSFLTFFFLADYLMCSEDSSFALIFLLTPFAFFFGSSYQDYELITYLGFLPMMEQINQEELYELKPWKTNQRFFKTCKINAACASALLQHSLSSQTHQVMGILLGKFDSKGSFQIYQSFALPVHSTQTRVNAGEQAQQFLLKKVQHFDKIGKKIRCVGWYHSHPGYGCWLSGIDIQTQKNYELATDPWVSIVLDPHKSIAQGHIQIGAYRTCSKRIQIESGKLTKQQQKSFYKDKYYSLKVEIIQTDLQRRFRASLMKGLFQSVSQEHQDPLHRLTSRLINSAPSDLALRVKLC